MSNTTRSHNANSDRSFGWLPMQFILYFALSLTWMDLIATHLFSAEQPLVVRAKAISGSPYGVGLIELSRERALELGWYSDQAIEIKSSRSTVWLPAVKEVEADSSLVVYFIYSGERPTSIEVAIEDNFRFRATTTLENGDPEEHFALLNQWWQTLCDQSHGGISSTLSQPSDDLLSVLGNHLKLNIERRSASGNKGKSQLENEFERSLGLLLGFESIRLAMMIDDATEVVGRSPALYPLPTPINVQSVRMLDVGLGTNANIESIATMVPNDCFYVRCRSIQNYSWLRQLLINWGGSLDEIVTSPSIDSDVTPYARREYGFLANYLAEPTLNHAAIQGNELMGVSAHLRGNSRQYLAHLGLCDTSIPFQVRKGELQREGEYAMENLAQQQSFAAVTPAGREGLQLLAGLVKSLQMRESNLSLQSDAAPSVSQTLGVNPFMLLHGFMNPSDAIVGLIDITIHGLQGLSRLNAISEDAEWSIYSDHSDLRLDVRQRLMQKRGPKPTQIHLHAGGTEQAAIGPYLHAYSYCIARQQSAANAVWLNRWTNGLRATPKEFRDSLEKAMHGKLRCPLGGNFILPSGPQSTSLWTSTAWNETSLAKVNAVPSEYRFPFLHWLKNVDLDFNLSASSLSSRIVLEVAAKIDKESRAIEVANH